MKTMDNADTKNHAIRSRWLLSEAVSVENILSLSEWLDF